MISRRAVIGWDVLAVQYCNKMRNTAADSANFYLSISAFLSRIAARGYSQREHSRRHLAGVQLEWQCVDMEKDLGVVISNDLKVWRQCRVACSKASKMLGLINRTTEFKHRDVLIRLYKSLVRPHLEFCTPAWSPHYRKDRDLIEKIQRRFTRMIPNISN